jgi:hypothetical protein
MGALPLDVAWLIRSFTHEEFLRNVFTQRNIECQRLLAQGFFSVHNFRLDGDKSGVLHKFIHRRANIGICILWLNNCRRPLP